MLVKVLRVRGGGQQHDGRAFAASRHFDPFADLRVEHGVAVDDLARPVLLQAVLTFRPVPSDQVVLVRGASIDGERELARQLFPDVLRRPEILHDLGARKAQRIFGYDTTAFGTVPVRRRGIPSSRLPIPAARPSLPVALAPGLTGTPERFLRRHTGNAFPSIMVVSDHHCVLQARGIRCDSLAEVVDKILARQPFPPSDLTKRVSEGPVGIGGVRLDESEIAVIGDPRQFCESLAAEFVVVSIIPCVGSHLPNPFYCRVSHCLRVCRPTFVKKDEGCRSVLAPEPTVMSFWI